MKTYRTQEQFETIGENVLNGNRTDAAQNCVDFGFYSNDLLKKNDEGGIIIELEDMVLLVEMATELRYKK